MEKIYLVIQESNVDGELLFNAVPCSSLEIARKVMQEEKETILSDSFRYKDFEEHPEDYQFEEDEDSVFINLLFDDYYEQIHIEEKEIITE